MISKDKDKLEKHPLAQRASQCQVKQRSSPPLQLQEQDQEPEASTASDGEEGYSRSAKGQVLRGVVMEGERQEGQGPPNKIQSLKEPPSELISLTIRPLLSSPTFQISTTSW